MSQLSILYSGPIPSAKYDERCKKVGDVASKLKIDEATFREIQVYL